MNYFQICQFITNLIVVEVAVVVIDVVVVVVVVDVVIVVETEAVVDLALFWPFLRSNK